MITFMAIDDQWPTISQNCSLLMKRNRSSDPESEDLGLLEIQLKRARLTSEIETSKPHSSNSPHFEAQQSAYERNHGIAAQTTIAAKDIPTWKSFVISTRNEPDQKSSYRHINEILHNAHVMRYGDPETHSSKFQQPADSTSQQGAPCEYNDINAVLRQAFLQRHRCDQSLL
ncbi:hypothetical protein VTP01DRAFT_872 [Rhizomucor pusillus]|uniref:uncharacterized protein n=1 Tax=Rhizomucor pusillus TaxID=4840 RepID=UPI0037428B26